MLTIEWLWVLLLLPLPWLYRYALPVARTQDESALRVPFLDDFKTVTSGGLVQAKNNGLFWLAVLVWACLVLAAARPQWLGDPIELPVSGRDIMLAVDLSGSMEMEDFVLRNNQRVDRLTAIKAVAGEFIERRVGDRLGLILFGRQAYVQTPLTFDRKTVKILLDESVIGLAGKETAIGDAIGLAVKRFRDMQAAGSAAPDSEKSKPILILLTDGANTAGEVAPAKAAELAAQEGLKIYTIGIGADQVIVPSLFGARRINPSIDLDEGALTAIAEMTGGKYFRARDTRELEKIYQLLDELEPIARESKSFRPKTSLYFWPLSIALLLAMAIVLLMTLRR
ncbi:MAG TPA: VWA domain-containing protein [Gammaproteobacteria bacterium]